MIPWNLCPSTAQYCCSPRVGTASQVQNVLAAHVFVNCIRTPHRSQPIDRFRSEGVRFDNLHLRTECSTPVVYVRPYLRSVVRTLRAEYMLRAQCVRPRCERDLLWSKIGCDSGLSTLLYRTANYSIGLVLFVGSKSGPNVVRSSLSDSASTRVNAVCTYCIHSRSSL